MVTDNLRTRLETEAIDVVHVGQFDYGSVFRERRLRREQFLAWASEPRFANVLPLWDCADNLFGSGPYLTEKLRIDANSWRRYGFEPKSVAIVAEFDGSSADLMPRHVLRTQIDRAAAMGFDVLAAFEFEVLILAETAESLRASDFAPPRQFAPDNKCWSGQTAADQAEFVAGLEKAIVDNDVALFSVAGELGPGCFEATLGAVPAMKAADDACFFRMAARSYARRNNLTASFMSYLGASYPAIGGHIHLSLLDKKTGRNIFSDAQGATNEAAKQFIAGMTNVVPQAFALCAHTVNAYRRFAPGSWAPKSMSWSDWKFTTAVRSAPSSSDTARLEFRVPGADCNPHLSLALMLGSGLDGLEKKLASTPPAPDGGPDDVPAGAIRFPSNLAEAAERLRQSADAKRLFGSKFAEHFAKACDVEHASLARAVSNLELKRYLEG